jgi:hypothetical protein
MEYYSILAYPSLAFPILAFPILAFPILATSTLAYSTLAHSTGLPFWHSHFLRVRLVGSARPLKGRGPRRKIRLPPADIPLNWPEGATEDPSTVHVPSTTVLK